MGSAPDAVPEVSLVVKNTFLEFMRTPGGRTRSFSDTELLDGCRFEAELFDTADLTVTASGTASYAAGAAAPTGAAAEDGCGATGRARDPQDGRAPDPAQETFPVPISLVAGLAPLEFDECEADWDSSAWTAPAAAEEQQLPPVHLPLWVLVPCSDYQAPPSPSKPGGAWSWHQRQGSDPNTSTAAMSTAPVSPAPSSNDSCSFDIASAIDDEGDLSASTETRTTVMLRNLPRALTRGTLVQMLRSLGFGGHFDFVYIPVDFGAGAGLGYAFINMVSPSRVPCLWECFDGFSRWDQGNIASDKVCSVSWSDPNQGLEMHVERYRNSPVMHPEMPDDWKPALFSGGLRIDFPGPTRKLKAPKTRGKKAPSP